MVFIAAAFASVMASIATSKTLLPLGPISLEPPAGTGNSAYDEFLRTFVPHSRLDEGVATLVERRALFEARRQEVVAHNNQLPRALWFAAVNRFADLTTVERTMLLGYKRVDGHRSAPASWQFLPSQRIASSATPWLAMSSSADNLVENVDWRHRGLRSPSFVQNQGSCGSCWAMAAVGALETHLEIASGNVTFLSSSELIDCVPNPKMCGGTGGCNGATSSLAFDYAKQHGVAVKLARRNAESSDDMADMIGARSADTRVCMRPPTPFRAMAGGFVQLPTNRILPLMHAVASSGPVSVSVDASNFFHYSSGVFDACHRDAVVNHAMLLLGYGHDKPRGPKFWLLRNSWGTEWGEHGNMRLLRHDNERAHCGTDYNPLEGSGCIGGPKQVPVCGMCGILSDSSFPVDVRLEAVPPATVNAP